MLRIPPPARGFVEKIKAAYLSCQRKLASRAALIKILDASFRWHDSFSNKFPIYSTKPLQGGVAFGRMGGSKRFHKLIMYQIL